MSVYQSTFAVDESPLSEGGRWSQNNVSGKTKMQTVGGNAFGTAVGPGPDDSYAYLAGFGDSVIETTVFRSASLLDANSNSHEIEHLHRLTDDAGTTVCYEVDMAFHENGLNVVRWSGSQSFVDISASLVVDAAGFPDGATGQWRDGYKVKTECVLLPTPRINIYVDTGSGYVLYQHYVLGSDAVNDNPPLAVGDPAIAAFSPTSSGDPATWFGFKDVTITSPSLMMGRAVGSNAYHPGRSPGRAGISSARFTPSNWWPYTPPPFVQFDPSIMAAMGKYGNDPLVLPPQVVASGMTPPDQMPT